MTVFHLIREEFLDLSLALRGGAETETHQGPSEEPLGGSFSNKG